MDPENTNESITELRKQALEKIDSVGEDAIHPKDLQRVKKDDNWLKRFLKHNDFKQKESFQMLWTVLQWRKENNVNDICEENVSMEILVSGGFFPRGKDIDGCTLLIFKCKEYVKNQYEPEVTRRTVLYWMERLERQTNGQPITLFFDMEKCGLANMDLDFTKYLIGLFKDYYPFFLNYVIVFEMPWILSAAFKVIKSWLPERAVKKIKFVSRSDLEKFVPKDQALTCWGGEDDYTFRFESEEKVDEETLNSNTNNRKVRFHDAKQMSDVGSSIFASEGDGALIRVVSPEGLLKFVKDHDNDFACNLVLQNISTSHVSYKVKTTTPEKFRVRPGIGILAPGATIIINISLLAAYKTVNVSKDKFLILSTAVDQKDMSSEMLHQTWKNTTVSKENQIHLRCAPMGDVIKNGSVPYGSSDAEPNLGKVTATLQDIRRNQLELNHSIKSMMYIQIALLVLVLAAVLYLITSKSSQQLLPPNSGNGAL
ncbi:motile sperm domain-containing protein 2-like [Coccinella septempunctata]|uniref:motile sperm domain-containing protein 2-like n=1 Tax=Coccinella septempunctata TaxID=41139 RepID=UPI001D090444|nr:motile sperm domain-containing protein 2-like [Coccinella septempunctata]